jgi:hypothetical protein
LPDIVHFNPAAADINLAHPVLCFFGGATLTAGFILPLPHTSEVILSILLNQKARTKTYHEEKKGTCKICNMLVQKRLVFSVADPDSLHE